VNNITSNAKVLILKQDNMELMGMLHVKIYVTRS